MVLKIKAPRMRLSREAIRKERYAVTYVRFRKSQAMTPTIPTFKVTIPGQKKPKLNQTKDQQQKISTR